MSATPSIWTQLGRRSTTAAGAAVAPARPSIWLQTSGRVAAGHVSTTPATIPPTFDEIFGRVAAGVPVALLKSNSWHESAYDPKAMPKNKSGKVISSARGLGQVMAATLKTFNAQNRANYSEDDLFDPEKNAIVQAWLFNWIATQLNKESGWPIDWDDPRFVAAVLLGYGAGATLVPKLAGRMHKEGVAYTALTTAALRKRGGELYPSSAIYVDPKLADANGKGPWASSQEIADNVAMKMRDYLALRGVPPAAAAAAAMNVATPSAVVVSAPMSALAGPAHASSSTPRTSSTATESSSTWGKVLLAVLGGVGLYKIVDSQAQKKAAIAAVRGVR